jgi:hypothetical protein
MAWWLVLVAANEYSLPLSSRILRPLREAWRARNGRPPPTIAAASMRVTRKSPYLMAVVRVYD